VGHDSGKPLKAFILLFQLSFPLAQGGDVVQHDDLSGKLRSVPNRGGLGLQHPALHLKPKRTSSTGVGGRRKSAAPSRRAALQKEPFFGRWKKVVCRSAHQDLFSKQRPGSGVGIHNLAGRADQHVPVVHYPKRLGASQREQVEQAVAPDGERNQGQGDRAKRGGDVDPIPARRVHVKGLQQNGDDWNQKGGADQQCGRALRLPADAPVPGEKRGEEKNPLSPRRENHEQRRKLVFERLKAASYGNQSRLDDHHVAGIPNDQRNRHGREADEHTDDRPREPPFVTQVGQGQHEGNGGKGCASKKLQLVPPQLRLEPRTCHLQRRGGVVEGDTHGQQPHANNDKAVPVPTQAVRTNGSHPDRNKYAELKDKEKGMILPHGLPARDGDEAVGNLLENRPLRQP
jgi:hypothetical protein